MRVGTDLKLVRTIRSAAGYLIRRLWEHGHELVRTLSVSVVSVEGSTPMEVTRSTVKRGELI